MSVKALDEVSAQVPADDFQELEEKVYRTIELYKGAREAKAVAEQTSTVDSVRLAVLAALNIADEYHGEIAQGPRRDSRPRGKDAATNRNRGRRAGGELGGWRVGVNPFTGV
ncbi:MAG: hypothetical protein DMG75_01360 [Acidobacteria bacterium]|nr:MAG: hypothetical protein DMG75_01360 [Acidobacteriota bacterium]